MGKRLMRITPEVVVYLTPGVFEVVENAVPPGAAITEYRFHGAYGQHPWTMEVVLEHPDWDDVDPMPILPPAVIQKRDDIPPTF